MIASFSVATEEGRRSLLVVKNADVRVRRLTDWIAVVAAEPEEELMGPEARPAMQGGASTHPLFVCPRDRANLLQGADALECTKCGTRFPIVNGVPVLINDENSVFAVADYTIESGYAGASYGYPADRTPGMRRSFRRIVQRLKNLPVGMSHFGHSDALTAVRRVCPSPDILVVGSGAMRVGRTSGIVVYTDVAFASHIDTIADAHDLPFPDASFDLVVAVAVLEHVADPQRCVAEFWRVLRPEGHVFAVTPFLQPVHMGAYDFTRFTPLGHRRLFRCFDAVEQGVAIGPGTVFGWSLGALLESVSAARLWRKLVRTGALVFVPPLRLLDRVLRAPASRDAAGGSFFFGRRRADPIPDRVIIQEYRGGFRTPRFEAPPDGHR
jgi:SAM-dependent methyltransferase